MAELQTQIGAVPLMNADTGLPLPQRYWAIVVVALGITLAVLDGAIANVALPTIARDLHATAAASIWVVNAYQLAITISLLPLASLGDRIGYRRIYMAGLALFTLASLGCALSSSLPTLAAMRVIQGFGAAGHHERQYRARAHDLPAGELGRGVASMRWWWRSRRRSGRRSPPACSPVAPWPWLFAINVPIGIAAIARRPARAARQSAHRRAVRLPERADERARVRPADHGRRRSRPRRASAALIVAELIVAAVIGYFFVRRQLTQPAPLLPVDLMRIPVFALSICTSVCSFTAQMLAFVSLPFLLQDSLGLSQVQTGFLMTPWPLVIVVAAPLAGVLSDRYSAGVLGGIGLAMLTAGLLLLATIGAHPGTVDIAWRMALCGAGFGLFQSPNNRAMLSSAPRERSGGASGMLGTARLTGQTLGAALVALIFGVAPQHGPTIALMLPRRSRLPRPS